MCAPPICDKKRPPIWKILDPPLLLKVFLVHLFDFVFGQKLFINPVFIPVTRGLEIVLGILGALLQKIQIIGD